MNIKQVIVMRTDLNMRKGKMIVQGSHASMGFILEHLKNNTNLSEEEKQWVESDHKKICLQVASEDELLEIYDKAKANKLTVHLVTDLGLTEFNGIPTKTCLAIGPNDSDLIDNITGNLKLL